MVCAEQERAAVFVHLKWAGALKDWDGPAPGERPAGYGACMLHAFNKAEVACALGLAQDVVPLMVIALGKPGETVVLEDMATGAASTDYWRDEKSVHHVPKRTLDQVLL